jgi:aldose 1-epimerase
MPLALGFHPYFVLPGVKRTNMVAHLPVRLHVETDSRLVPTGELTAANLPDPIRLEDRKLDDGFTDLIRDAAGNAIFWVSEEKTAGKRIEVAFGPKYPAAVVYHPLGEDFICFEPMTALTNGVNLAYEGKYPGLQMVEAGGAWAESFWVRPSGF